MSRVIATMIILLVSSLHVIVGQSNNADDYSALRVLFLSTDGDNWFDKSGWYDATTFNANPSPPGGTDMSGWYGITCNAIDRVNEINLLGNALKGNLPF